MAGRRRAHHHRHGAVTDAPLARARYWDDRYDLIGHERVSWFQTRPVMSLELIATVDVGPSTGVIDVGGGSSRLVDELIARGFADITVLDVSQAALQVARRRLDDPHGLTWLPTDVLTWTPVRRWGLWHDRAAFHFLTEPDDQATYLHHLARALSPNGSFIIATFAPDGPDHCSGLAVSRYDPTSLATTIRTAIPAATITASRAETHTTPSGATQPFTWVAGTISG